MATMKYSLTCICLTLFMTMISWQAFGQAGPLILTSPPRESQAAGEQLFVPLAKYLSELTGRNIIYRHPGNWMKYQRDMRRNEFDVVFDGPHFASWRIKYFDHVPVAKLPGTLQFYLVTNIKKSNINIPKDIAAKRVCVIPPPNLSSLVLLARTDGPAREPILETVKGGMDKVYQALEQGECEAAMFTTMHFNKKLSEEERSQLKIIYTSPELPNQVITVSDRLTTAQQQKIADALTNGDGVAVTQSITKSFAGPQTISFVRVINGEYQGYSELLESVILGWRKQKPEKNAGSNTETAPKTVM